ncbi:SDR family NAD(P)-dependent oxidoreductase [Nostoc sp. CENA67]|uniref:Phenolphthiocerol/phthiocerol polyketide synthase subunit E n=1 Tax=Amazonocrinis nigriterrae CENA67 TaxID=2794033 RepID=A0A8J7L9S9_9NOST|nr:type I polyketide synthase [Amazonocrinis nigriterrae]MBH8561816.1 SDR family NAD(P)-dependent oxidoreductase [Amazonocrinis nigriterrae CENA67]
MNNYNTFNCLDEIAIIGMSGCFPGAKNIEEFWQNLRDGVESISFFTEEELVSSGININELNQPNYVKAKAILDDIDLFDAAFFEFSPKEAEITDPQHRLFLEHAWTALENAGYDSKTYTGQIGVYAGVGMDTYFLFHLYPNRELIEESIGKFRTLIGNRGDFLPTLVSYKLNLKGPSVNVQTACSTSLVAVHFACQSLLNGESDIALAGGVNITLPHKAGYRYQEGGILSPDGHCRAFDAKTQGTLTGNGVGIVVLKLLKNAIADGDYIHAVIKSSAINNDGSLKVGYTAPSVDGQAKVIAEALSISGVHPETISYIETHGTGTNLGDPIEIAALTKSFRTTTQKKNFCAIGSLKTNIGHLDAAAGIAGFIKTVLALKHKQIPPSLHFEKPNPQIDFANSPFYVNVQLSEWKTNGTPRRAGVSSFGIGGTNAHVILEEAPVFELGCRGAGEQGRGHQLLVLSAKTSTALETATTNLTNYLQQHPELNFADVAYTLSVGRRAFEYRQFVVAADIEDAIQALTTQDPQRIFTHHQQQQNLSVVFMFPGQGSQYINMGWELYQTQPIFRQQIDNCCEILKEYLAIDLRDILYPSTTKIQNQQQLIETKIAQPALFVIEYALAKLWMAWGVKPDAMIGHSIGEYVAACLAGVFTVEDALRIVATRGQLMQQLPSGKMLAIPLSESELQSLLNEQISLAASNAPSLCVVSGTESAIADLQQKLSSQGIDCRQLHTSHAFHSVMMNPIIPAFTAELRRIQLQPPTIAFVSNVTGTWITTEQATDPDYWAKHLTSCVRFADGIAQLQQQSGQIFLEVGPGRTLSTLLKQYSQLNEQQIILNCLRHPQEQHSDVTFSLNTLGQLWLAGVEINWSGFYSEQHLRVPLPTYPFERQRYWIEPQSPVSRVSQSQKQSNIAEWFYTPVWKQSVTVKPLAIEKLTQQKLSWLLFVDDCGLGSAIASSLQQLGHDVIIVTVAQQFGKVSDRTYCIHPQQRNDYDALLQELHLLNYPLDKIVHFWGVTQNHQITWEQSQAFGFNSLLFLAQALAEQGFTNALEIFVVTNNLHSVIGDEQLCPEKATVLGPCQVIGQEYFNITCRSIDIVLPTQQHLQQKLTEQLLDEFTTQTTDLIVAYRGHYRWVQNFEQVKLEAPTFQNIQLRQGGVYLITGGLGGIGLSLAEYLAQTVQAKIVLIGRSNLPEKDKWEQWLETHDQQNFISQRIKKVQALEKFGAEVLVKSADVTNQEQMQALKTQVIERFGAIHGVIHAAGIAGGGMIQIKTTQVAANVLAPKVQGTLVIDHIFQGEKLDFIVLCSALASIVGGFGQVDYCAANAFLDKFAQKNSHNTICINWCAWQEVGMFVNTAVLEELKERRQKHVQAIKPKQGIDAFNRILASSLSQVVISKYHLPTAIEQSYSKISLEHEFKKIQNQFSNANLSKSLHSRPKLKNDYVAPRNDVEKTIAKIWQNILGIEQIGVYDNFFELGGHSLLATQVISQIRKALIVELPLRELVSESPTIAHLAEVSTQLLMGKIAELSEEEVQRLLEI